MAAEVLAVDDDRGIEVAVSGGSVWLVRVKPAGKREMDAASFVRGYGLVAGETRLGADVHTEGA